ncbi:MAG: 5-(carboxyamino)imidazole ribonucleotide synthase, partial [Pseudomonadaceae bacterium]|nr:5-(carboxyamino)imidazole ribonucleotide synthase [Pseudomonadaceae bacterium]
DIGQTLVDKNNARLEEFLSQVDVVSYEFEHLPVELVRQIEQQKPVYPSSRALQVCQNRGLEKALFTQLAIPTPEYHLVDSLKSLQQAVTALTTKHQKPVVIKTVTEGYDGKGQAVLKNDTKDEVADVWQRIGNRELIVEAFIDFVREVSIIAVRSQTGEVRFYPMAENYHLDGILRYSFAPLPNLNAELQRQAETYIKALLNELDYVGVLTLELFQQADGQLMANEMAPRVHNSGHWTQNGAATSQFENHLRAVAGLPLGSTAARLPTCMVNIIGKNGDVQQLLQEEGVHLHLYGKEEREGRKLGHLNLVAANSEELLAKLDKVAKLLPEAPLPKFSFVEKI